LPAFSGAEFAQFPRGVAGKIVHGSKIDLSNLLVNTCPSKYSASDLAFSLAGRGGFGRSQVEASFGLQGS
jgi:hypothetical protein